jgi:hypothetical protein
LRMAHSARTSARPGAPLESTAQLRREHGVERLRQRALWRSAARRRRSGPSPETRTSRERLDVAMRLMADSNRCVNVRRPCLRSGGCRRLRVDRDCDNAMTTRVEERISLYNAPRREPAQERKGTGVTLSGTS